MGTEAVKVGFLGAGKMATALARGWISRGLLDAEQILASSPEAHCREHFSEQTGARATGANGEVVESSEVLVLAVKPQVMATLLAEIRPRVTGQHLVISVAAGITLRRLRDGLSQDCRVIRVMPNTPCLVGESASGYCPASTAKPADVELVDRLLNAVGRAFCLPESLMDAVTGLAGSGPAYVAVMIEALADGGVLMGLPRDVAMALASTTVVGAAKMVRDENLHPAVLKDMVASPGGTTIAGLHALERGGIRDALVSAVKAATQRSRELGI
jgi:pyrroline-5-carboxylate reductase